MVARIRAGINRCGLPLSAIEFNANVSRKRLRRYLNRTGELSRSEIKTLVEYLRLDHDDPDDSGNYGFNKVVLDAVGDDVMSHSIAYIAKEKIATGTFVTIGEREFIATAAHTVPSSQSETITLVGYNTNIEPTDIQIIARGRKKGCEPDVGYIEIEPGTARKLGRTPIGVDRLCYAGVGQPGRTAFLYGFPTALAKRFVNHKRREIILGLRSFTYPQSTLAVDEWPAVPSNATPPSKSVDVFLIYDTSVEMIVDPADKTNRLPDPSGASGGGIWQSTSDTNGLWSTDSVKLIAIQSGWHEPNKYTRGVQINHWVRLIRSKYPDLKVHLADVAKV